MPKSLDEIYKEMIHSSSHNFIFCDPEFTIQYINPETEKSLRAISHLLPIKVEEMVGSSIDVFHKNPVAIRNMLKDHSIFPHTAVISLGEEKLELNVNLVKSSSGVHHGYLLTWNQVTEKIKNENEMVRIKCMIDNAPVNIMMADRDFNLIYMNPKSMTTLRTLEHLLPKPVDQLLGQSIDIFHKNPSMQRKMLADDRNLPHQAKIKLGDEILDLLVTAVYDSNQEYTGMMVTWEVLTERVKLNNTVTQTAEQLGASAKVLSEIAQALSANAKETTAQSHSAAAASEQVSKGVEVVATNTEEMTASIKEIARNAKDASGMANHTKMQAENTNQTITQLSNSSNEIGNVIKVISSIAQQTNLLALNATIEAARAGDAGRGFAVVANEVKELAKQTAAATEDITAKISAIQEDSTGAVSAIKEIADSIQLLNEASQSIAAAVEQQRATTAEVSRVVQDSNKGVQEISGNVRQVSQAANDTSAGIGRLMDTAQELNQISETMLDLVKNVKI